MENPMQEKTENEKNLPQESEEGRCAQEKANPVMRENAPYFLGISFIYGICFAVAFYRNFIGITFPLITAATLWVCGLFIKKNGMPWKKSNWLYAAASILLGISTVLTANGFVVFFNTVGILLLVTVFMLRQVYDSGAWGFGQYICNILFLYLSMVPEIASPFVHLGQCLKKIKGAKEVKMKNGNIKYILLGILMGLPMLFAAVGLLSSADQIFSKVVGEAFRNLFRQAVLSPNLLIVAMLLAMGFFGSYCFLSALSLQNMPEWKRKANKKNPVTAITFISMVTVVYLLFCGIQVAFLFTGGRLLPEGYTYAEYARQGFFQLLFVCVCNLALVLFCLSVFGRHRLLKALLLVFSGCTYIMLISSAYRMALYVSAYRLSFLRVLVFWFLALLAFLLAGVILNIQRERFQLFRYCMAVVTVFYLVFSFGRPDTLVAAYNLAQFEDEVSYQDVAYLTNLSMDAVPALSRCRFQHENHSASGPFGSGRQDAGEGLEETSGNIYGDYYKLESRTQKNVYYAGCRRCRLEWKFQQVLDATENMGIRTFHFSKYRARKAALDFKKNIANTSYE